MPRLFGGDKNKTFKPTKKTQGQRGQNLRTYAQATLGSGDLRMAVTLPEGEDIKEWIGVNTVDFFNQIGMLYATLLDHCTEESCPRMTAGPGYEYLWAYPGRKEKPQKMSAPGYITNLMEWVQTQLNDEELFPSQMGVPFPKRFIYEAKQILRRLFRVYAHMYHAHFSQVVALGEEAHLNTSFKHFIFFVLEFQLIDRSELMPMSDLIDEFTR